MSKLGKRLEVLAGLVCYDSICDVGCDHGKLPKYLLDKGLVSKVIISDISPKSLSKAEKLLTLGGHKFESICCDGLSGYAGKSVDQCIISGLGGQQIIDIIRSSPIEIQSFVLSPQHENIKVKQFMLSLGYVIDFDIIILEKGKFYNIFRCERVKSNQDGGKVQVSAHCKTDDELDFDLYFGRANFESPLSDIYAFKEYETEKAEKILANSKDDFWVKYLKLLNKIK